MRVLMTGRSGLIGCALTTVLESQGHEVVPAVRKIEPTAPGSVFWSPIKGFADVQQIEGMDAVVHLAGENIASGRWTRARKREIKESRILGTRTLCEALSNLNRPPRVLVMASAVGYYGDRGDEVLTEESSPGRGFLADVVREWEAAAFAAEEAGLRVVFMRLGAVLSEKGGALRKMLLPCRLGLGGRLGSGRQFMSWIAIDDVVRAFCHAIETESVRGPVNTVAPNPVTNLVFMRTLGRVLHRPTFLPLPAPVARIALGEIADELLLASCRAIPAALEASGFRHAHATIDEALGALVGRTG